MYMDSMAIVVLLLLGFFYTVFIGGSARVSLGKLADDGKRASSAIEVECSGP